MNVLLIWKLVLDRNESPMTERCSIHALYSSHRSNVQGAWHMSCDGHSAFLARPEVGQYLQNLMNVVT